MRGTHTPPTHPLTHPCDMNRSHPPPCRRLNVHILPFFSFRRLLSLPKLSSSTWSLPTYPVMLPCQHEGFSSPSNLLVFTPGTEMKYSDVSQAYTQCVRVGTMPSLASIQYRIPKLQHLFHAVPLRTPIRVRQSISRRFFILSALRSDLRSLFFFQMNIPVDGSLFNIPCVILGFFCQSERCTEKMNACSSHLIRSQTYMLTGRSRAWFGTSGCAAIPCVCRQDRGRTKACALRLS